MGAAVSFEIEIPIVAFIPVWAETLPTLAGEIGSELSLRCPRQLRTAAGVRRVGWLARLPPGIIATLGSRSEM